MLKKELAELLGKVKGFEERKLLGIGKPNQDEMMNEKSSNFISDKNIKEVSDYHKDEVSTDKKRKINKNLPKDKWIDKKPTSQIPQHDKKHPFLPDQNDLPF